MATIESHKELLDSEFMKALERLSLVSRKIFRGLLKGERRSKKKGVSIEFEDYRNYVLGDDLRFLDWNIFARLDRLFLKLFQEEEDLNIFFLIDGSESMNFGTPTKFLYAKKIAAALGYVALGNLDRVAAGIFSSDLHHVFPLTRGKNAAWRLFHFLQETPAEGATDLCTSLRSFALRFKSSGIVIILSDYMDPAGVKNAFKFFSSRQYDLFVVQILSQEELQPQLVGDIRLLDSETDAGTDLSISAELLQRYQLILQGFQEHLRRFCHRQDIFYTWTSNQVPFEELVLRYMKGIGLLK